MRIIRRFWIALVKDARFRSTPASVWVAAEAVCDLFGEGWPRIEVLTENAPHHDRMTLPLSDDDADKVRALRHALGWTRQPGGRWSS